MHKILIPLFMLVEFSSAASLILNPSFEDSDMSAWTRTEITGIRPWGRGAASPQDGSWFVFTVNEASISQTFTPTLGSDVGNFSFWVDRPLTANMFLELSYADGSSSGQIDLNAATGPGWTSFDALPSIDQAKLLNGFTVTKLGTRTARLDNFQVSAVPEASTMTFLGLGLALALRRKRPN